MQRTGPHRWCESPSGQRIDVFSHHCDIAHTLCVKPITGQLHVDRISNPSGSIARLWDGLAHMNHIMSKKKEIVLGAVHCGREIAPGLFAETVETGRFLIRIKAGVDHAKRVGEVCGGTAAAGTPRFQALTRQGATVAIKSSLKAAALALAEKANVLTSTTAVPFITARGAR